MCKLVRWFPLPDLYGAINNPALLKRYAVAYMYRNYPDWKPKTIQNYRVLAERSCSDG
ncbi:hypothetical protein [Brevibacillus reuszeri]|nr:hypothetical protein [Brevibacillus reuszeri]MED1858439.1 hypothetical protein [Brevibacillus reuszeri]